MLCIMYANCDLTPTKPASVSQLDARSTGDQEAAGSTPTGSAIFFRRGHETKGLNGLSAHQTHSPLHGRTYDLSRG